MRARLGQADLPNLVLSASGCAGAGRELAQFIDVARVGALISKSIMAEPHTGNPAPRLAETPSGLLNSVGLQGPGMDAFLQRDLPWLLSRGARVVVSIAGPDHPRVRRARRPAVRRGRGVGHRGQPRPAPTPRTPGSRSRSTRSGPAA